MAEISYRGHRFPSAIIQHAVWLYLRFTLSYRDVEELLAERGLDISYETVRCWVLKFGPVIAGRLRRCRPRPSNRWHLDEMVVRIAGERMYLWRAVDREGEVLDMLVQRRRDTRAALRLMRKLLKKQGFGPKLLVTDKLRSYACAFRRLRLTCPETEIAVENLTLQVRGGIGLHTRRPYPRKAAVVRVAAGRSHPISALIKELAHITGNDRYPFSSRIQTLRAILAWQSCDQNRLVSLSRRRRSTLCREQLRPGGAEVYTRARR